MSLQALLDARAISKYRLSKISGVSKTVIQDICSGKSLLGNCTAKTVYQIAVALDCSVEELLKQDFSCSSLKGGHVMSEQKMPLEQILQKCKEKQKRKLYHGSSEIVKQPIYGFGTDKNDFGRGFYCTEVESLAKEWAVPSADEIGYCNEYCFDMTGLKVLNLHEPQYNLLNWAALLFKYRDFPTHSYEAKANVEYLEENFGVNLEGYDVIIGPRADDSYFAWAKEFVADQISVEQLERAMRYGGLGDQIVLISQKAFEQIEFVKAIEAEPHYFYLRAERNAKADKRFDREKMEKPRGKFDFMASDIREGGFKNEDFCVSRDLQGDRGR